MSMIVKDIVDWLNTLDPFDCVGVDDGGLCLRCEERPEDAWLEIGGLPEEED